MATAIEQYLSGLQAGSEGLQGALDIKKKQEEEALLADLAQRAPELLQSGQQAELLAQLSPLDGGAGLREAAFAGLKAQNQPQEPGALSAEQLLALDPNLRPEQVEVLAGIQDPNQQRQFTRSLVQQPREDAARRREAQQRIGQSERSAKRQELFKWADDFNKLEKDISEERRSLEKVKAAMASNTIPGVAVGLNFIARNMAGEKGPLSNDDLTRLRGKYAESTLKEIQNYFSGNGEPPITAEQKAAYNEIIGIAEKNFGDYQTRAIGERLERINAYDALTGDRKLPAEVRRRAKKYGFEYDFSEDGILKVKKQGEKQRVSLGSTEEAGQVKANLDAITNPRLKSIVTKAIQGKTSAQVNKIIENALKQQQAMGGQ